jgi:hypothetical protein
VERPILIAWKISRAGTTRKVECSSTFMACPRAFRRTKNAHWIDNYQRKLPISNVRSARSGKAIALENCL